MNAARFVAAAVLLVAVVDPRDAAANMAAPPPASQLGAPGSATGRTPIEVRAADLVIDCSAGGPTCLLEATYQVHNPGDAPAGGIAAFYALGTGEVTITVDGAPVDRELVEAEKSGLDAAVQAEALDRSGGWSRRGDLTRHGFELAFAPGAGARVVVRGQLALRELRRSYGYGLSAGRARHLLFMNKEPLIESFALAYLVAPLRTWGAWPSSMSFMLRHPASWRATIGGATPLEQRREGDVVVWRGTVAAETDAFHVELVVDERTPLFAGVLLGIGGLVDDATGTVLRAGGELAIGDFWLASVVLDLELADETGLTVVPTLAVGSPWLFIIPALSVGIGVPVRLAPDVEVGARIELDVHMLSLGLATAFDYYPGMDDGPRRFQVTMLLQLGL